jgi:hypothetical protein
VKFAAFAHSHGDRAGEQADASREDMQNQERKPHLFPTFTIVLHPMQVGCEDKIHALPG